MPRDTPERLVVDLGRFSADSVLDRTPRRDLRSEIRGWGEVDLVFCYSSVSFRQAPCPTRRSRRMPGSYHIIQDNSQYWSRRVPCYETGRYHRHKTHIEEYARAACGAEVNLNTDTSCNLSILDPRWNKDWCHKCVRAYRWTGDAWKLWRSKGIEALTEKLPSD